MPAFPDTKPELRRRGLAHRDALSPAARREKSLAIATHGAEALSHGIGGLTVAGYHAIRSEADVGFLLNLLEQAGAQLALPAVLDRETIVFRSHLPHVPLVAGGFGTMAPGEGAALVEPDVLLMPLSVFDEKGNRIGYGAGHYDRAIDRLQAIGRRPVLIGVAFDLQEVPSVPAEPHDVPLDGIVTESGLRWFSEVPAPFA